MTNYTLAIAICTAWMCLANCPHDTQNMWPRAYTVLFNVRVLDIRGAAMTYLASMNTGHNIWYMLIQKNMHDMVHCQ
jgi:hypothetical protein